MLIYHPTLTLAALLEQVIYADPLRLIGMDVCISVHLQLLHYIGILYVFIIVAVLPPLHTSQKIKSMINMRAVCTC